jgi:hypothetical protein
MDQETQSKKKAGRPALPTTERRKMISFRCHPEIIEGLQRAKNNSKRTMAELLEIGAKGVIRRFG